MVFPYLLSLIFNIYVVLYSVLFPFVHSVYLAIFILLCLFFIFDKVLHLPIQKKKKKKKTNEGANLAKSNPWLRCVYKDRRGEERWGMGWRVTLPLFGCFEGERIWGDFIISWVEANLLLDFVWMDKYFGCSYFIDLWLKATTIGSLAMPTSKVVF